MCDIAKLKLHRRCKTPTEGVAVLVHKDRVDVPICKPCWDRIGDGDWEVGDSPKIENFQEWLVKSRGLEGTVLTIYDPSKKGKARYQEVDENET